MGDNPRYIVTSLNDSTPEMLYADIYCKRGQFRMEEPLEQSLLVLKMPAPLRTTDGNGLLHGQAANGVRGVDLLAQSRIDMEFHTDHRCPKAVAQKERKNRAPLPQFASCRQGRGRNGGAV